MIALLTRVAVEEADYAVLFGGSSLVAAWFVFHVRVLSIEKHIVKILVVRAVPDFKGIVHLALQVDGILFKPPVLRDQH